MRTTGGAPGARSPSSMPRPSAGATPYKERYRGEISYPDNRSGTAPSATGGVKIWRHIATSSSGPAAAAIVRTSVYEIPSDDAWPFDRVYANDTLTNRSACG